LYLFIKDRTTDASMYLTITSRKYIRKGWYSVLLGYCSWWRWTYRRS